MYYSICQGLEFFSGPSEREICLLFDGYELTNHRSRNQNFVHLLLRMQTLKQMNFASTIVSVISVAWSQSLLDSSSLVSELPSSTLSGFPTLTITLQSQILQHFLDWFMLRETWALDWDQWLEHIVSSCMFIRVLKEILLRTEMIEMWLSTRTRYYVDSQKRRICMFQENQR